MRITTLVLSLGCGARLVLAETFDYVIVGAGTAGAVIASRLSENPSIRVAIIEAGDDARDEAIVQEGVVGKGTGTHLDWNYTTTPQTGANNRVLGEPAGRGWGGTSLINGMVYLRPKGDEVDAWEQLGNPGWNWRTLFPFYKKSEEFVRPLPEQSAAGIKYEPEKHGFVGPVRVGYNSHVSPAQFYDLAGEGWKSLSVSQSTDLNKGDNLGFGFGPQTLDPFNNTRWHASRAYLEPAERRSNLRFFKGTVQRLTWSKTLPKGQKGDLAASGVEYITAKGILKRITAKKEIILSAGTFRSPGILERSGVGNPRILKPLGIKTNVDLPGVGENFSEQPSTTIGFTSSLAPVDTALIAFLNVSQIFGDKTSDLEAATWANIPKSAQALVDEAGHGSLNVTAIERLLRVQHNLVFHKGASFGEVISIAAAGNLAVSLYMIQFAFSRGSVHLRSQDSLAQPVINPRVFHNDFDMTATIALGRLTRSLWRSEPLRTVVLEQSLPDELTLPHDASDEQWTESIRSTAGLNYHPFGTCSMMARELGGVVSSELKVYGTRNVRVIDGSIIPMQISGHPTATIYAIAERAARIIQRH